MVYFQLFQKSILTISRLKQACTCLENTKNRFTVKDYRHEEEFSQLKASNFLSRIDTIDSPKVIFTVADQIGPVMNLHGKENDFYQTNSMQMPSHFNRSEVRRMNEERLEAINLAKWMD